MIRHTRENRAISTGKMVRHHYTLASSTIYVANFSLCVATHALVCFEEENRLAVVPVNRIKLCDKDVQIGSTCSVLWSNRKVYDATLILTGKECIVK